MEYVLIGSLSCLVDLRSLKISLNKTKNRYQYFIHKHNVLHTYAQTFVCKATLQRIRIFSPYTTLVKVSEVR